MAPGGSFTVLSSPPPERLAAAVADPLRACSSRGPICSGGAAWEQLLPWVPWGIWVLADFFPQILLETRIWWGWTRSGSQDQAMGWGVRE